jgi:DNA mismatch endonuclease (patch repair protein)
MTDLITKEQRSANMRAVRSVNTVPEMLVRKIIYGMGYRFRLHRVDLPGKPDIALPRLKKVIYVHGCFWHRHKGCRRATVPQSNRLFWRKKFRSNVLRDAKQLHAIRKCGWRALIVWECEIKNERRLATRLKRFLCP